VAFCGSKRVQKIPKTVPKRAKKKQEETNKQTKQKRTEEDDAVAARERCEKRVRGCEGMEALETILGSLVQDKKTQQQDWKSSERKKED
jgi:hypothetical protein